MKSSKIIVTFAIFLLLFSITTLAAENYEINYENQYDFNYDIHNEGINVENDELFNYLIEQSKAGNEIIDVLDYQISETDAKAVITKFFLNEEVYYVSSVVANSYENGYLKNISLSYIYSQEEIATFENQLNDVVKNFISGFYDEWCDKEKVLYTDIFLCKNIEAGTENEISSHTIVGALINGSATSDGYAKAFNYLFKRINGKSEIVTSTNSTDTWNMAEIDGVYYHVDCFSNDIPGHGKTTYEYLIKSDYYMYDTIGREWVSDVTSEPVDEYDADWFYTEAYLQYIDGYWYYNYNNPDCIEIDRFSFETEEPEYGDPIEGIVPESIIWGPSLTYDGENFYASTNKEIYIVNFDFDTYEATYQKYFILEDENRVIYSIEFIDGKLYYDTTDLDSNGFTSEDSKTSNVYIKLIDMNSDETEITIEKDEIYDLSLIKDPIDSTENIKWESLDPEIVIILNENGKIQGVSLGTTQVVATCHDLQIIYNITVKENNLPPNPPIPPEDLEVTNLSVEDVEQYKVIIFNTKTVLNNVITVENFPVLVDDSYSIQVLDKDGNEKSDWSENIGSRNTIVVYKEGNIQAEFTAIVPGDVTGNGILRMYDAFQILKEVITGTQMDCLDNIIRDHSSSGDRIVRMYDAFQYLKEAIMS